MAAAHRADHAASRSARRTPLAVFALVVALAMATSIAHAGQVRVDVGPGTDYSARAVNLNKGDHVVWVWLPGSNHSVTAGDSSLGVPDGPFDSDPSGFGQGSSTRFSWKSDLTGTVLYYCDVHLPDMASRLIITDPAVDPPIPVADFRLTEVQYDAAGGQDLIEITNMGNASGNLGRYRLAVLATGFGTELPVSNVIVAAGGRVVIHLNATGTNTNTDVFIPSFVPGTGLGNTSGTLALYAPNVISPSNALTRTDMILDFVQWGAASGANEGTAVGAGFWVLGTFVPPIFPGHSIEYCTDVTASHGVNRWVEAIPNFGSPSSCATQGIESSWGRIKTLYRK